MTDNNNIPDPDSNGKGTTWWSWIPTPSGDNLCERCVRDEDKDKDKDEDARIDKDKDEDARIDKDEDEYEYKDEDARIEIDKIRRIPNSTEADSIIRKLSAKGSVVYEIIDGPKKSSDNACIEGTITQSSAMYGVDYLFYAVKFFLVMVIIVALAYGVATEVSQWSFLKEFSGKSLPTVVYAGGGPLDVEIDIHKQSLYLLQVLHLHPPAPAEPRRDSEPKERCKAASFDIDWWPVLAVVVFAGIVTFVKVFWLWHRRKAYKKENSGSAETEVDFTIFKNGITILKLKNQKRNNENEKRVVASIYHHLSRMLNLHRHVFHEEHEDNLLLPSKCKKDCPCEEEAKCLNNGMMRGESVRICESCTKEHWKEFFRRARYDVEDRRVLHDMGDEAPITAAGTLWYGEIFERFVCTGRVAPVGYQQKIFGNIAQYRKLRRDERAHRTEKTENVIMRVISVLFSIVGLMGILEVVYGYRQVVDDAQSYKSIDSLVECMASGVDAFLRGPIGVIVTKVVLLVGMLVFGSYIFVKISSSVIRRVRCLCRFYKKYRLHDDSGIYSCKKRYSIMHKVVCALSEKVDFLRSKESEGRKGLLAAMIIIGIFGVFSGVIIFVGVIGFFVGVIR